MEVGLKDLLPLAWDLVDKDKEEVNPEELGRELYRIASELKRGFDEERLEETQRMRVSRAGHVRSERGR